MIVAPDAFDEEPSANVEAMPEQMTQTRPSMEGVPETQGRVIPLDAFDPDGSEIEQPGDGAQESGPRPPMFGGDYTSVPNVLGEMARDVGVGAVDLAKSYGSAVKDTAKTFFTEPFGPAKVALGSAETALQFGVGGLSWLASKPTSEIVNLIEQGFALDPELKEKHNITPESIARRRELWEEKIGSFLPNAIGGPYTDVAKKQLGAIEDVFEYGLAPLHTAEKFYAAHGYPNVGKSLSFAGELVMFKGMHKGAGKVKTQLGKLQKKLSSNHPKDGLRDIDPELSKINEAIQEQAKVNDATLSAANKEHRIFIENEHRRQMQKVKQDPGMTSKEKRKEIKRLQREHKAKLEEGREQYDAMQQDKQLKKQAEKQEMTLEELIEERLKKNQRAITAQWPEIYEKAQAEVRSGKPVMVENIPGERQTWKLPTPEKDVPGPYTQVRPTEAQRQPGAAREPAGARTPQEALERRPDLGAEPESRMPREPVSEPGGPSARVEARPEETVPRRTYQTGPEGTELITDVSQRRSYQIDPETGQAHKIAEVPEQRRVWQILQAPLKGQKGEIDIGGFIEMFGKRPKGGSLYNQLIKKGLPKDDLMLSGIAQYLKANENTKIDPKTIARLAEKSGPGVERVVLTDKERTSQYGPETVGYNNLTLPGYEPGSYREVLYKYQGGEVTFQEPHFPGKLGENTFAHTRIHGRDVQIKGEQKASVHLDEIQSKLHDIGRQEGYVGGTYFDTIRSFAQKEGISFRALPGESLPIREFHQIRSRANQTNNKAVLDALDKYDAGAKGVPDVPFKKTWPTMILRDAMRQAVEQGKDAVTWNTGKILRKRYPNVKADFESLYDKTVVKQAKKEFGIKPEKVKTETGDQAKVHAHNRIEDAQVDLGYYNKLLAELKQTKKKIKDKLGQKARIVRRDDGLITARDRRLINEVFPLEGPRKIALLQREGRLLADIELTKRELKNAKDALKAFEEGVDVWHIPVTDKMRKQYRVDKEAMRRERLETDPVVADYITQVDKLNETLARGDLFDKDRRRIAVQRNMLMDRLQKRRELLQQSEAAGLPGQQSVFEIILEPLRNQSGQITIPRRQKTFRKKMNKENMDMLLNIGRTAEQQGKTLEQVLRDSGMEKSKVKSMIEAYDKAKVERPFGGKMAEVPLENRKTQDFDPFTITPGERKVNVRKTNNRNIQVDTADMRAVMDVPFIDTAAMYQGFQVPWSFFQKASSLKPLHYWARDIKLAESKDMSNISAMVKTNSKEFRSKKKREELGKWWMSLSESGKKALDVTGTKYPKEANEYAALKDRIEPVLKDLYDRVNETRVKIGKPRLAKIDDYFAFFMQESLWDSFVKTFGKDVAPERPNLVLDSEINIQSRHRSLDSTVFKHVKRGKVIAGTKLEFDPLVMVSKYGASAVKHIHASPLVAFVREIAGKEMIDPKTGKAFNLAHNNPKAASYLTSWGNKIGGVSNFPLPKTVDKALNTLTSNLTAAILLGNLRTVIVQPSALAGTYVMFGTKHTGKALTDMAMRKRIPEMELSTELSTRIQDASISSPHKAYAGTRTQKVRAGAETVGYFGMKWLDYFTAETTWRAAWNRYEPLVREGKMSTKEAVRLCDDALVKANASGAVEELSPIQRNALGKAATLWQTFVINHANFMAKEVFGVGNKALSKSEIAMRTARLVVAYSLINSFYEDQLKIQSPYPTPVRTFVEAAQEGDPGAVVLLRTLMETGEFLPLLGGMKYGTSPLGGAADYVQKTTDLLSGNDIMMRNVIEKALEGDPRSVSHVAGLIATLMGVTGAGQAAKYTRGRIRGEGHVRSLIGKKWDGAENKSSGGTSSSRRSGRSGRSTRRTR